MTEPAGSGNEQQQQRWCWGDKEERARTAGSNAAAAL